MKRQQDSNMRDPARSGPSSPRVPGHSTPSDTRSNAASGLTQQGRENQRPGGERNDASSERQPGSTLDARLAQPGPQAHQQAGTAPLEGRAESRAQTGKPLAGESMLDDEDPLDPRERV